MSNMGYCRFTNTLPDIVDCYNNMDKRELSVEEKSARDELIKQCVEIACDYGHQVGMPCERVKPTQNG